MDFLEKIKTSEMQVEKTLRNEEIVYTSSAYAGKVIPGPIFPLLREDRVQGGITFKVDMAETALPLMNPVSVTVSAYLCPNLAFNRFEGSLDRLNRSYMKQPDKAGGDLVPFVDTIVYDRDAPFFRTAGIQEKQGATISAAYVEAYNEVVNYRMRARTSKLTQRDTKDLTLAPCFWRDSNMRHIRPDFDEAAMEGEVALNIVNANLPVKSTGRYKVNAGPDHWAVTRDTVNGPGTDAGGNFDWSDHVWAELKDNGITVSLANIEQAKQVAMAAMKRKEYSGIEEEHVIDLLMQGIRVPDQMLAQPMLLDRKSTIIGINRRFATDSGNLDKSVTTGETEVTLNFATPPINTGGIIVTIIEIVPQQLFERQRDQYLQITDTDDYPEAVRDFLDTKKVSVVPNKRVDVEHSAPDGVFGYEGLNREWDRSIPRIGGKFFRAPGDPFVGDRQRIWGVEQIDPELQSDFYLVPETLHHNVFQDNTTAPFEITALGGARIVGNTVMGRNLEENTGDYDKITDQAPTDEQVQP